MSAEDVAVERSLRLVEIARSWVGVRFRPQGRGREGVDCIGLAAAVWNEMGVWIDLPADYQLRCTPLARVEAGLTGCGFRRVGLEKVVVGDLLIAEPVPGQTHVVLLLGATLIEANARAGRVVERRWAKTDLWVSAWRYGKWEN